MGPMTDPMAGNGKMRWQRWNWKASPPQRLDQIKDGGAGLMETVAWHPQGSHFVMAGRQAQGSWNAALFAAADGALADSVDCGGRVTGARFTASGHKLILSGANGQPPRKAGAWPPWGRVQIFRVEA
jgi:hypothetical protein